MRKVVYFFTIIMAFILVGCAGNAKRVKLPGNTNKIIQIDVEKNVYTFTWRWGGKPYRDKKSARSTYKAMFQEIANVGLAKGYSYAAIVNNGFNNLSGYPINSWNSLNKFIDLYGYKHYWASFSSALGQKGHRKPKIKVVYLKERPKGLFLWNLKTLRTATIG